MISSHIFFDHLPDVSILLSSCGKIQNVNASFMECLQFNLEEVQEKSYTTLFAPNTVVDMAKLKDRLAEEKQLSNIIHTLLKKDGTACTINWSISRLGDALLCIGRNEVPIAGNQQTQFEKEHLFEALVENSFDLLAVTDANGVWTYVSESLATLLKVSREKLIGQVCFAYMHPDDLPNLGEQMQRLLAGERKIQSPAYRFKNGNGEWLWMEAIVTNQLDNPDINGIIITGRDISDRILAEKNAKEVLLLEALREGEEKERSRISRDLHDGVAGMVAAAKMHLTALGKLAPDIDNNSEFLEGLKLLDEAAQQIRRTSHNLMPEILLENGLDKALNQYIHNISNTLLQLHYAAIGDSMRYTASFELSLYRIVQELLNNIIRHSNASKAIIQLSFQPDLLSVTIEDNGVGFDPNAENAGTGLRSIRKRVSVMNGSIEIHSATGKGTNIYLEFVQ